MPKLRYTSSDDNLTAREFLDLTKRIWPGDYDTVATASALARTINTTARDIDKLVAIVRVLSDGYFYSTLVELLVDPDYQGFGVGRRLMELAWEASPTSLHFGVQPEDEGFYEKLGYKRGLQSYYRIKPRNRE